MPRLPLLLAVASALACSGSPTPESKPGKAEPVRPAPVAKAPDAPADPKFPDVVVLTLDTTRADHLGLYGYFRDTSPQLDRFAKDAVVFDRFIVPMATTLPTHTSVFTGVYPLEHGVTANIEHGGKQLVASEALTPLAVWLAGEGYQTGGFTSAAPLNSTTGIERGFQAFTAPTGDQRPGRAAADDAITWLKSAGPTPMLMWVHFYDPHNPYHPDPTYAEQFKDDPKLDAWLEERKVDKVANRPTGEPVRAKPTHNQYDAEIRTMDDQIQRVLDAVQLRGRADNTVFIILGDHGEGLNQHGEPGHGQVWDEQLHAPWILKAPGLSARRVARTVSAVDVLPTVLAAADLPAEDKLAAQFSGRDALADTPPTAVLSQSSGRQVRLGRAMAWSLTEGTTKCVWPEGGEAAVYDLLADPHELSPLTDAARAKACADKVQAVVAAQRARGESLGAGKSRPMSDEQKKMLEELGYLQPTP